MRPNFSWLKMYMYEAHVFVLKYLVDWHRFIMRNMLRWHDVTSLLLLQLSLCLSLSRGSELAISSTFRQKIQWSRKCFISFNHRNRVLCLILSASDRASPLRTSRNEHTLQKFTFIHPSAKAALLVGKINWFFFFLHYFIHISRCNCNSNDSSIIASYFHLSHQKNKHHHVRERFIKSFIFSFNELCIEEQSVW